MLKPALLFVLLSLCCGAFGQSSPIGLWRTIDDETGEAKSLVRISKSEDGSLQGVIEQVLNPEKRDELCANCKGELRDQPILGMRILWDFKESNRKWSGGDILDPNNGKVYSAFLKLKEHGRRLEVRGYIGISLIGRSQIWQRVE